MKLFDKITMIIFVEAMKKKENLPELLTRAELCVQKLATDNDRSRKEKNVEDVMNPPPTPETDGHENENSCDGMENSNLIANAETSQIADSPNPNEKDLGIAVRKLESYEDDFLDIGTGTDMDLF